MEEQPECVSEGCQTRASASAVTNPIRSGARFRRTTTSTKVLSWSAPATEIASAHRSHTSDATSFRPGGSRSHRLGALILLSEPRDQREEPTVSGVDGGNKSTLNLATRVESFAGQATAPAILQALLERMMGLEVNIDLAGQMRGFDYQPSLSGSLLQLRPLGADDFTALHASAADPGIWEQHPVKDRHREDVFRPYLRYVPELARRARGVGPRNRRHRRHVSLPRLRPAAE